MCIPLYVYVEQQSPLITYGDSFSVSFLTSLLLKLNRVYLLSTHVGGLNSVVIQKSEKTHFFIQRISALINDYRIWCNTCLSPRSQNKVDSAFPLAYMQSVSVKNKTAFYLYCYYVCVVLTATVFAQLPLSISKHVHVRKKYDENTCIK
jgi:hypothetical protein